MPRSKERVTADALIEIASDPNRYKELMVEYEKRQRAAVEAEGKATVAERAAEAADARAKSAQANLTETSKELAGREATLVAKNEDHEHRLAKVKGAETAVTGREHAVHQREDALAGLHSAALEAVAGLIRGVK